MGGGASVAGRSSTGMRDGAGQLGVKRKPFCTRFLPCQVRERPKTMRRQSAIHLEKDFGFHHQKDTGSPSIESRGSWKRKFSLTPRKNELKMMDLMLNGRSIERSSPCYDPLLVFRMDTTVLAAITVQKLVRGYFARLHHQIKFGELKQQRISKLMKSPSRVQALRDSAFTDVDARASQSAGGDGSCGSGDGGEGASTRSRNQEDDKHLEEKTDARTLDLVLSHKQKAIEARQAGDTKLALEHMGRFKALKESLGDDAADILTPRMNRRRSPADITPVSIETCKRKAIAARKAGDTELAVEYMADYSRMKAYLESQARFTASGLQGEGQSRSSSTSPATNIESLDNSADASSLEAQIDATKSAAILAKRAGRKDEAIAQMKRYKSLLARMPTQLRTDRRHLKGAV